MKKLLICSLLLVIMVVPCIANAATINGKVTQWTRGQETSLSGATVIIGANVWLDTNSSYDVVRGGKIAGKTVTDANGKYAIDAPAGKYYMIIWKAGYIPADRIYVTVPSTHNDSISRDNQVGSSGRHVGLRYE